jgi:hypothetical protein
MRSGSRQTIHEQVPASDKMIGSMFGANFSQLGAVRLLIVHICLTISESDPSSSRSQFQLPATHSVSSLISSLAFLSLAFSLLTF